MRKFTYGQECVFTSELIYDCLFALGALLHQMVMLSDIACDVAKCCVMLCDAVMLYEAAAMG